MNQYDLAGILRTCAGQCSLCKDTEKLKRFIRQLKKELNGETIKKIRAED